MIITRRTALALTAARAVSRAADSVLYKPQWASLEQHTCPEWFRDAKFGIYFHWGLYSVPAFGNEWYPHWMYLPGRPEYAHHLAIYGPLDKFGYKDFAPRFTAEHFDADRWVTLFRQSGARYAGPVAEHADGFSMWASHLNPWNAARIGPRRDIVGEMERAVRRQGLKFYTSFHHQWLWGWYASPIATADIYRPEYAGLYWPQRYAWGRPTPTDYSADRPGAFNYAHPDPPPSTRFCELWRDKVLEVVDRYHPDIIYFDSRSFVIPETYRLELLAHYYNSANELGREVTITFKEHDFAAGSGVADFEAGQLASKARFEWQTDDVLDWNSWAYLEKPNYKDASRIIHQLIDVVSKNGNMLLDVGPRADGSIPEAIVSRLNTVGAWLRINGEAIYGTRPWEVFGEGPTKVREGMYVADHNVDFGARDIRFTTRARNLYVHVLGDPGGRVLVTSIRRDTPLPCGTLTQAQMLGGDSPLVWEWSPDGLVIELPTKKPSSDAFVIRLS